MCHLATSGLKIDSKHKHSQLEHSQLGKGNHNYLKNVSCKRRKHYFTNYNNSLSIITKVNIILELQIFLEHNHFSSKLANKV
jgi:hypothetical protein